MDITRLLLWFLMACQMVAWAWFSFKGGKLSDKNFYIFTLGMMIGQTGAAIETFLLQAWGTFIVQVYFFVFTGWGLFVRFQQAKKLTVKK